MKRIGFLAMMMVLTLPIFASADDTNPWDRQLPFESATITYTISGTEKGTETLYIKDHGKEMATYSTVVSTAGAKHDTVTITNSDWVYRFDLERKTGSKNTNPQKYMRDEFNNLSKADQEQVRKNAQDLGANMMQGMSAKVETTAEKILGYDCDKVTVMGSTVYSIHKTGIPLKSDTSMMGYSMKKEATAVKEGAPEAKAFLPPEGIVAQEDPRADAMAKSMAKQTIAMLKNPEGIKASAVNPMMHSGAQRPDEPGEAPDVSNEEMEHAMKILKGMQQK